jgi:Zn-dependent metalloprotease
VRDFCGRDSGRDRSYNRHFVTANWVGNAYAKYQHAHERIFLSPGVATSQDSGTIAHEFGHQTDLRNRNDYISTTEGEEVEEALADMFGYDFERDSRQHTLPSIKRFLASPGAFTIDGVRLPSRQADYNCTVALDEHINGYILGHAYYRMVERLGAGNPATLGHPRAGAILQFVPFRLPARRTFGAVRVAFEQIAGELYGATARSHVSAAFNDVGVTAGSSRAVECPGATP